MEENKNGADQIHKENEKTAGIAGAGAGVVAGAQLGTVILPIPVVGTFTGALVGGIVGSRGNGIRQERGGPVRSSQACPVATRVVAVGQALNGCASGALMQNAH